MSEKSAEVVGAKAQHSFVLCNHAQRIEVINIYIYIYIYIYISSILSVVILTCIYESYFVYEFMC
jgi:hypothetical protein